jgi:hypothetical protein
LIEFGADPSTEDTSFHSTVQGWAEHNGQTEAAALLGELTARSGER